MVANRKHHEFLMSKLPLPPVFLKHSHIGAGCTPLSQLSLYFCKIRLGLSHHLFSSDLWYWFLTNGYTGQINDRQLL